MPTNRSAAAQRFPLAIGPTGRYLVDRTGKPFLIVGDTAWSLIAQLNDAAIDEYLSDRASRGFNAIIVNLLEHKFSSDPPRTRAGLAPFTTRGDFSTPNGAYFDFAHRVAERARAKGIAVWLFPGYLGYNGGDQGWFKEMKASGEAGITAYGAYVGRRFRDLPNLVWGVGGDYTPPKEDQWTVTALARGIRSGDPAHPMTAHFYGQNSAVEAFGDSEWLNLNAVYSSDQALFQPLLAEYRRRPVRPFVLLESTYEAEHGALPERIRRQAYWAMLCGACGQFFGNNPIWHFDGPGLYPAPGTWREALGGTGSRDMMHLRELFEGLPWHRLVPDLDGAVTPAALAAGNDAARTAATEDRKVSVTYIPSPASGEKSREIKVDLSGFPGPVTARWYNPTSGKYTPSGGPVPAGAPHVFHTPGDNGTGASDWVLTLTTG